MIQLRKITGSDHWRRTKARRLAVVAGVSIAALVATLAGVALAADTKVTLTSSGPQPGTITVNVGDSVTFTNSDGVNHSIVTKTPSGYSPGGFVSPPIRPGQSYSVGLSTPGTISYTETGFGRSHGGKIVVKVAGALAISAAPKTVVYGSSVTITGSSPLPGTNVVVSERLKGQHGSGSGSKGWQAVATVPSGSDGTFTATVTPKTTTTYRAQTASGQVTSPTVAVAVAPELSLRATTPRVVRQGKLVTLVGKIVPADGATTLELVGYDTSRHSWSRITTRPVSPSTGTATFRYAVPHGLTQLRLAVSKSDHLQPGLLKVTTTKSLAVRGTGPVPPPTTRKHHRHKHH